MKPPEWMLEPAFEEFKQEFEARAIHGTNVLSQSAVAIVGLARNCGRSLPANLHRASMISKASRESRMMIFENDSVDDTKKILAKYEAGSEGLVKCELNDFGRKQRASEMAGPRTVELAEYRTSCQEWVRQNCQGYEYTVVIDWDAWGGWIHSGAMTGFSYLATEQQAFAMASVSLLEQESPVLGDNKIVVQHQWMHYDCWALRLNAYWDDYSAGVGGWKHNWIPLVGSQPIRVCSAFGGFAVYKTQDYLRGTYSGQDCEHVTFHRSIQDATGSGLYLNPSQRTIMQWIERDAKHSDSSCQPVQS